MNEYVRITDRKIELTDEGVKALMTQYTPTTEEVRESYVLMQRCISYPNPEAQFDRWLAEVKADAWQDGAYHIAGRDNELVTKADAENPYRQGEA